MLTLPEDTPVLLCSGKKVTLLRLWGIVQKTGQTLWRFSVLDREPLLVCGGCLYTLDDVDVFTEEKETNPGRLKDLHGFIEASRRTFKHRCGK